ncbi:MAG: hypothetical protein ABW022_02140 [Actinoplanes sp.]
MTTAAVFTPAQRRRRIARGLLHAVVATTVLVVLYFTMPLDRLDTVPVAVSLAVALLVLLGVSIWQVHAILRNAHPGYARSKHSPPPRRCSYCCSR